ncbi:hypothetical protein NKW46_14435, partial [Acetobacter indonesiensis]
SLVRQSIELSAEQPQCSCRIHSKRTQSTLSCRDPSFNQNLRALPAFAHCQISKTLIETDNLMPFSHFFPLALKLI